jgi:hypothetical protein
MQNLSTRNDAERTQLFSLALSSYTQNSHDTLQIGAVDDFPRLTVRFWRHIPPPLALQSVHEILKQTKDGPKGTYQLSSSGGAAQFDSPYEYRLFELLPILRQLDAAGAEDLLQENASIRANIEKYPKGLQSLDPTIRDTPLRKGEQSTLDETVQDVLDADSSNYSAANPNDAFGLERVANKIASKSELNVERATAQAMQLPVHAMPFYPRMDALVGILRANWNAGDETRKLVLAAMEKTYPDCPPYVRAKALFAVLDLYKGSRDKNEDMTLLARIVEVAIDASKWDADSDDPNGAFKVEWPSTKIWDKLLQHEKNVSIPAAKILLNSIPDSEQKMIETVHLAGGMLGVPEVKMPMSVQKNGEKFTQTGW